MKYEAVIGLEVHVQLKTKTKAFCGCSTAFGNEPNSQVCPVCLGFPGSLPVLNKAFLDHAIKVALALNCTVQNYTKFDRKNYFYPDLPKNYQISQYDLPLSREGFINIEIESKSKTIGITRVHMEEDAGKLVHKEDISLVDFNRAGMPLLEIVSEPDINTPQEAYEYLTVLKQILEYLEVSDCDMEKGTLRCDANVSIRELGAKKLGTKTEVKNMNSFKGVRDALAYEIKRQIQTVESGGTIVQETLLWDPKEDKTFTMRTKEGAQDYRYFPEPDLTPFIINKDKLDDVKKSIPELPKERLSRFVKEYGLSDYDAGVLISSKRIADYFEGALKLYKSPKVLSNWIIGPLMAGLNSYNLDIDGIPFGQKDLISLIKFVEDGKISNLAAKEVLAEMFKTKKLPWDIIQEKNLAQVSDKDELSKAIGEVIAENPKSAGDYKSGKANALMFLVGQVMKKTKGKANPKVVQELLVSRFKED